MNIPTSGYAYFPSEIITDGKIVEKNLKELKLSETWVREELRKNGVRSVEEVFYAEIGKDGELYISK